jgi:hypothetical protein
MPSGPAAPAWRHNHIHIIIKSDVPGGSIRTLYFWLPEQKLSCYQRERTIGLAASHHRNKPLAQLLAS